MLFSPVTGLQICVFRILYRMKAVTQVYLTEKQIRDRWMDRSLIRLHRKFTFSSSSKEETSLRSGKRSCKSEENTFKNTHSTMRL